MEDRAKEKEPSEPPLRRAAGPNAWMFIILAVLLMVVWSAHREAERHEISQDFFVKQLDAGNIAKVVSVDEFEKTGTFKVAPKVPPIYKDGKYETPMGDDEKPRRLAKEFVVRLDPQISNEERERISQSYGDNDVQVYSRPRRDSTKLFQLLPILAILLFMNWIWMLIDCLRNEPSEGNDKIVWVLVLILLNGLGALIYLIVRRPERMRRYGR